jgi:hypothetical protein
MPYIDWAMKNRACLRILGLVVLACGAGSIRADTAAEVYRAMGIQPATVLTGTVFTAKVLPGADKQVISVTTYLTGSRDKDDAVNVRLDVFRRDGDELTRIYGRDFGKESGGPVGEGELQLLDLDLDGVNEIIASYRSFLEPLIDQRIGEVVIQDDGEFRSAWSGQLEYDATRAARDVPRERRDRFTREFDFVSTMRTHGITLFVKKQMIAVAGERLAQPKVVQETFPLRSRETTR